MRRRHLLWPAVTGLITAFLMFGPLYCLERSSARADFFHPRVPGLDHIPPEGRKTFSRVKIGEFFTAFKPDFSSTLRGSWPAFRGTDSTNISRENIRLLKAFGKEGPPVLWRIDLGEGHAAPAIHHGRFYLLDYLEGKKADALRCFSLLDGEELWRRSYTVDIKRNHGYSRTVPAVNDRWAVSVGPMGHVMCVEAQTGNLLWSLDMVTLFDCAIPQWYTGQCPLIEGDRVILAPGGEKALLVGIDAASGDIVWKTPNPGHLKMSHSSVMPMRYKGQRMYVYAAIGGIVGVAADGEQAGRILWKTGEWGATVIAPSPVIIDEGTLYQSAGYGAGSIVIRLSGEKPPFLAETLHRFNPRAAMATEQQTAIYHDGLLFGVLTKDAGTRRMMLVACDPHDPSKFIFNGAPDLRFGLGPLVLADNRFFALADDGHLSMLEFKENRFVRTGHSKVLPGVDAWGPMAIADGLMLLRDSTSLACLDLTEDARWSKRRGGNGQK